MTWKEEILRALLLAFGFYEMITNLTYLIKKDGLKLARKQHQELPKNASEKNIFIKVICMLSFGALFFMVSLFAYMMHTYLSMATLISLILFSVYAISEAVYYKYLNTMGFAAVTLILLGIDIFL